MMTGVPNEPWEDELEQEVKRYNNATATEVKRLNDLEKKTAVKSTFDPLDWDELRNEYINMIDEGDEGDNEEDTWATFKANLKPPEIYQRKKYDWELQDELDEGDEGENKEEGEKKKENPSLLDEIKTLYANFPIPSGAELLAGIQNPVSLLPNIEVNEMVKNALKGEFHAPLHAGQAHYMGPGTKVVERIKEGVLPVNKADELALEHDLRYMLAKNIEETRFADEVMNDTMSKIEAPYSDRFIGKMAMTSKMALENLGLLSPTQFNDFTTKLTAEEETLLRKKLKEQVAKREATYGKAKTSSPTDTILSPPQQPKEEIKEEVRPIRAKPVSFEMEVEPLPQEALETFNFTGVKKNTIGTLLEAIKRKKRKQKEKDILPRPIIPRFDQANFITGGLQSQTDMCNVGPHVANAQKPKTVNIDLLQEDAITYYLYAHSDVAI